MHRRLCAPGKRSDLRRGAPVDLTWTAWVESKRHKLGRSLRTIQYLLRGKTEASQKLQALQPRAILREEPDLSIASNEIYCGDCIALMDKMPAGSVGLIVTSPPYNLRNSTGNGMKAPSYGAMWEAPKLLDGYDSTDDAMPYDEYVKWQRDCLGAMMRVLRDDGAIFWNHKWRVQDGLLQDRAEIVKGFPVRQIIIWHRLGGLNFNVGYFLPTYEVIYLICKPGFKLAPGAGSIGDVWQIPPESDNPHPAPFPVELARRCIESTAAELVLDPFIGSGTTAIAAEACNRDWIGLEVSEYYCNLADDRIEAARRTAQSFDIAARKEDTTGSIM
jgi:site-specific DNA-methyltransferase (adenine-specific)